MTDAKQQLKVVYDGASNGMLDSALKRLLISWGYRFWASGYDLDKDERDLAFQRPKPEEKGKCP